MTAPAERGPIYPGTVEFDEHVCEVIRLAAWEQCGVELPEDASPTELVRILYLTTAENYRLTCPQCGHAIGLGDDGVCTNESCTS